MQHYGFMLHSMVLHHGSFLIRKSADIMLICSSPRLIAACHVLHRLLMPRHSPYALVRLNFLLYDLCHTLVLVLWIVWVSIWTFRSGLYWLFYAVKKHFAFCTLFFEFHLSVKLFFPYNLERLNNLLFCPLLFVFLLKSFFYSVVKDQNTHPCALGRSGWTRTIDLALIRRAL